MKLILCSVDPGLKKAWEKSCGDLDFIEIFHGSILDTKCDAIVSPANSYGFMDGGLDALYMDYFGSSIQTKVRKQIYLHHHGELIVGMSDVVETNDHKIPFLIIAPTMRVPMKLRDSINPYLAARSVFILQRYGVFLSGKHKGKNVSDLVRSIALPGLCTGVGGISYSTCAHQVREAINDILLEEYKMPKSWAEASENHQLLYTNKPTRLQY